MLFARHSSLINYGRGHFLLGVICSKPGWPDSLMNQSSIYCVSIYANNWSLVDNLLLSGHHLSTNHGVHVLPTFSLYFFWVHCSTQLWLIHLKKVTHTQFVSTSCVCKYVSKRSNRCKEDSEKIRHIIFCCSISFFSSIWCNVRNTLRELTSNKTMCNGKLRRFSSFFHQWSHCTKRAWTDRKTSRVVILWYWRHHHPFQSLYTVLTL